jgi:hypothetical protein
MPVDQRERPAVARRGVGQQRVGDADLGQQPLERRDLRGRVAPEVARVHHQVGRAHLAQIGDAVAESE